MSDSYKIYASKDYVDSKALPDGGGVYQQLVTDANGERVWEERTHYKKLEVDVPEKILHINASGTTSTFINSPTADVDDIRIVFWDGILYRCAAKAMSSSQIAIGNFALNFNLEDGEDTGEPFLLMYGGTSGNSRTVFYTSGYADVDVTFAVYKEVINPISEDFIPTTIPVIPSAIAGQTLIVKSVDENGKPVEWEAVRRDDARKVVIVDMTAIIPNKLSCSYPDYAELFQRIGNDPLSFYEIERICLEPNGDEINIRAIRYEPLLGNRMRIYFGDDLCPIIMDATNHTLILDPDWVAPAEPIPAPAAASIGQTIAVKSVDENGKPTEWETIDPWVITSPNGTQFKLTIDNEGILSATELA